MLSHSVSCQLSPLLGHTSTTTGTVGYASRWIATNDVEGVRRTARNRSVQLRPSALRRQVRETPEAIVAEQAARGQNSRGQARELLRNSLRSFPDPVSVRN